jgi:putative MATE family efflux protein
VSSQLNSSLGREPISKLLLEYSLPAIIGSTAASIYNVIDRIFIGQGVGPLAISGLALTLPFMNLAIAFGALVGAGAAALVSIRLGERRGDEAVRILGTTVMLNLVLSSLYSVVMFVFLDELLFVFGASKETLPYARQFMQVILLGNVFHHSYMGLNAIMRASGYPRKAMNLTLATVAANLVLAPLFIFVFHWGIRGAAVATVTAQVLGLVLAVRHFMSANPDVRFLPGHFTFDPGIVRDIFSIGASPFFVQVSSSLVAVLMNRQLVHNGGDYAVGAFGVLNSVLMLVVMLIMGLTQGMQPIVGFNYGARLFDRMRRAYRLTVVAATAVAVIGFALCELFPYWIARAFTDDVRLLQLAETGMRIALLTFPLVGYQVVTSNFFQSIGRAKISIFLSLSRQVGFLIPALLVLPEFWGLKGVWASLPASDLCAFALTVTVFNHQNEKHF